jgi:methyl-accepting chemotaxis protein
MASVTQQNSANAEETASAAHELNNLADQLKQMLGKFKLENSSSVGRIMASPPPAKPRPQAIAPAAPKAPSTPAPKPRADDTPQIVLDDDEWGKY